MADIELVIKMPEEYYKSIKDDSKEFLSKGHKVPSLYEIVNKGVLLPKGHDDLIERNKLLNRCLFMSNDDTAIEGMEYVTKGMIENASPIIEADKE